MSDRNTPLTQAAVDVLAERRRQIEVEGWTPEHDDGHRHSELADAAACYATNDRTLWPWSAEWWKPTTRRRDLVRAAALILAEIERLDRACDGGAVFTSADEELRVERLAQSGSIVP